MTGTSNNTVAKLLVEAGRACAAYQGKTLRNLTRQRVQKHEIWSFVYAKNDDVKDARSGDRWRRLDVDRSLCRYEADC